MLSDLLVSGVCGGLNVLHGSATNSLHLKGWGFGQPKIVITKFIFFTASDQQTNGGYNYKFVESVPSKYNCSICSKVLCDGQHFWPPASHTDLAHSRGGRHLTADRRASSMCQIRS